MFDTIVDFRKRLADGQVLLGSAIYMIDPQSSDALADSTDFLWYDLEHQAMSIEALRAHLMIARYKNKTAIVRVPGAGNEILKPILDIGPHGIVVPQIKSVEQVQQIVTDCRYPPTGERGYWPMIPTNYTRDDIPHFIKQANKNLFVSVMIETAEAVDAIDEIVAIEGLDSVCMGLSDLSGSYGMLGEVGHPKVVSAMRKVISSAQAVGMPVGCGQGTNVETICQLAREGIQWFQTGGDCLYLIEFMDQFVANVRSQLASQ